jgi:hypothetical protein
LKIPPLVNTELAPKVSVPLFVRVPLFRRSSPAPLLIVKVLELFIVKLAEF